MPARLSRAGNRIQFGSIADDFTEKTIDCLIIPGYSAGNSTLGAESQLESRDPSEASNQCGFPGVVPGANPFHNPQLPAWPAPSHDRRSFPRLMRKHLEITPNLEPLFGTRDENLRLMEDALHAHIDLQSEAVLVEGSEDAIARVERIFQDYEALRRQGILLQNGELNGMLRLVTADPAVSLRSLVESGRQRSAGIKRMVQPRSLNQRRYVEAIEQNDMVFGIGPAGTGKTYLAVAMAASALLAKKVSRIVLVRPAVEAGERLGFLPGTLQEKVDPYLRPLYDALYDLMEPERVDKMLERNVIEIAPLAFMRGRTLNNSFIILDEAQNTTPEQMKMFLTRIGFGSKAVVTGDVTQIDLPKGQASGLIDAREVLEGVRGIAVTQFQSDDVVRHPLVQAIVDAYDRRTKKK